MFILSFWVLPFIILANTIKFCFKSFFIFSLLCILRIFLVTFTIYLSLLVFLNMKLISCILIQLINTANIIISLITNVMRWHYPYIYQNNNNNQNIKFSINIFIPLDLSRQHVIFVISWYYFLLFLCGYYLFLFFYSLFNLVDYSLLCHKTLYTYKIQIFFMHLYMIIFDNWWYFFII